MASPSALSANTSPVDLAPCVLTIGNFDGVHLGHQALLARLSSHARAHHLETAVLTFSPQPRAFFTPDRAPAQLSSLREKIALLAKAGIERVHICRFNAHLAHLSPEDFIEDVIVRTMQARHVLVGDDFDSAPGVRVMCMYCKRPVPPWVLA